ncbi:MAG: biopolymer transporter ExbD [Firmicutes bacterium]|nr:biopolymer transporter ExbD [Bacillota bacterium]
MAIERERRRAPVVNIVPLIDVMFFLVAFFMVFTTFRTDPTGIQVDLPRAATAAVHETSELRITVTQQGAFFINGQAASPDQVRSRVREAVARRADTLVIVSADRRAAYDHVVRAMDLAREAGAFRLALSVEPQR